MPKFIDMAGQKFGRLTAITRGKRLTSGGNMRITWLCRCDCGKESVVDSQLLRTGNTKSCGCWNRESARRRQYRHGMNRTPEYESWCAAKKRCNNPKGHDRVNYGGRGIKMCPEWESSFAAFYLELGPRPKGYSLDRIDVNRGYEPGNCRWATIDEQSNNRRNCHYVNFEGERMTISQCARRVGVRPMRLRHQLRDLGLPLDGAIKVARHLESIGS